MSHVDSMANCYVTGPRLKVVLLYLPDGLGFPLTDRALRSVLTPHMEHDSPTAVSACLRCSAWAAVDGRVVRLLAGS